MEAIKNNEGTGGSGGMDDGAEEIHNAAPADSELLFQRYQFYGFPRHGSGPLPGNGHY